MDEAHSMRNHKTTTFKSGELITSIAEHIVFLTATPVQNSLDDLFNILSLLENDYFKDYDYFRKMIRPNSFIHKLIALLRNNSDIDEIKQFIKDQETFTFPDNLIHILNTISLKDDIDNKIKVDLIDKLTEVDHLSFIINRTKKKDVGKSIPRNAKSVIVGLTDEEQEYYDAVIDLVMFLNPKSPKGFITIMPERMASSSMIASLESFKYMKKTGKLPINDIDEMEEYYIDMDVEEEAMKYLDVIIIKGDAIGKEDTKFIKFEEILKDIKIQKIRQLIVFSFFKKTLDYLEKKLLNLGYSVGKIHGDFSVEERFFKINEFRNGSFDILLSSEVGSEGLDMQFCNVVVNYDLPWNPMRVEQRIGRIDRIGQKFDKLHIFNLCIKGSIEDRIYNRLYEKLNIFESSIGELEPILGDLETKLNLSELINLSQDEIDQKIYFEELAIKRQEKEVHEQNKLVEELINEDINYTSKHEVLLSEKKSKALQEQTKNIFMAFLNSNNIKYVELKNNILKFSSENLKVLFNVLKSSMSDKKTHATSYKEERLILQKINKLQELKISFQTNYNEDFNMIYLYLNHPIISMITREKNYKLIYSKCINGKYQDGYSITFRTTIDKPKKNSKIKNFIFNKELFFIDDIDYFDFIAECDSSEAESQSNLENIKNKLTTHIIKYLESEKVKSYTKNEKEIDIKIGSVRRYYEKQIEKVKNLQKKVTEENVTRMRIREIENIRDQQEVKIRALESQKKVNSSFEILGVMELLNE